MVLLEKWCRETNNLNDWANTSIKGSIQRWKDTAKNGTYDIANSGIGYVPEDQGFLATDSRGKHESGDPKDGRYHAKAGVHFRAFPDLKKFWKTRRQFIGGRRNARWHGLSSMTASCFNR